jgi:CheY-like chemotaxis protein
MTTQARVLVIDDSLPNRELASAQLTAAGYSVQLAEDGEQGLAMVAARQPDLVLLDVRMPGMNGFEVCKRLRESPGGQQSAIVFATALNDLVSHQQALASGADDFLTKPLNRCSGSSGLKLSCTKGMSSSGPSATRSSPPRPSARPSLRSSSTI